MYRERFILVTLRVLILVCVTTCSAKRKPNCHPSSCGHIENIKFPFRLKTNPKNCGHPSYELACENNRTVWYLNSKRYYVQSISYESYTIQILDPGITKNQCSSFPVNSFTIDDIPGMYTVSSLNDPVIFVSCSSPVKSSLYVDSATCNNTKTTSSSNTSSPSLQEYSYVLLASGVMEEDLDESCKIKKLAWVSRDCQIDEESYLGILDAMANGFSLQWYGLDCGDDCEERGGSCYLDSSKVAKCQMFNCHWIIFFYFCEPPVFWEIISTWLVQLTVFSLAARFFCGLLCLLILVVYKCRRRHLSIYDSIEDFLQGQNNLVPIRYKYTDIKKMTKNFKNKLGEGGYGSVFKGKLRSGLFVAVKMMSKSKASGQEFINEVATIGRIHHVNVVQLIGFCVEGSKRALVYEFMPNGSLEKYIFSQEERAISLSYEKMFEIALGVARGIDYLHRGCDMQILHFDIKPHNILLNENFTPKVSDFGLAKLYPTEDSIVSLTAARGTMGYMAPELFYKNIGGVSYKADVYSYGMLLMEMAGRRKNLNPFVENLSQIYFPSWVYDQFNEGKEIGMGDTSGEEKRMVKKMILVALWCIQMKPVDRPSMNKIVEMLESDGEHLQMPPKPFLYPEESPAENNGVHPNDNELPLLSVNYVNSSSRDGDEI